MSHLLFFAGLVNLAFGFGFTVPCIFTGKTFLVAKKDQLIPELIRMIMPFPVAAACFLGSIAAKLIGW